MTRPQEHSAGIVIYRQMKHHREYLLLHYPGGHFEFAKGHMEGKESEREAALRELIEETGIDKIVWVEGYRHKIEYQFRHKGELIDKDVIFFLARTEQVKIQLSHEHQDAMWLRYNEALRKLTFDNAKNLLKKAENYLNNLNKKT